MLLKSSTSIQSTSSIMTEISFMNISKELTKLNLRLDQLFILIQLLRKLRNWHDNEVGKGFPGYTPQEVQNLVEHGLHVVEDHASRLFGDTHEGLSNTQVPHSVVQALWEEIPRFDSLSDLTSRSAHTAVVELRPV